MSWFIEGSEFDSIEGMDARASWLLTDSESDYIQNQDFLIPFVVRLTDTEKDDLPSQIVGELVEADLLYVSSWYLTESVDRGAQTIRYPKPGAVFVAYADRRFFEILADGQKSDLFGSIDVSALQKAAKSIELRTPLQRAQPMWLSPGDTRRSMAMSIADRELQTLQSPTKKWSEDTVIMAVIDDGIPIANTRFQNQAGSRVEYFWRQDGPGSSLTVPNGQEIDKAKIDNLLNSSEVAGVLDEDAFYHRAGLSSFNEKEGAHKSVAWRASHGAHVMDLAAGFAKEKDVQNRPIVAVQLPTSVVENTSGSELDQHVIDAIEYILQRAELLSPGKTLPLVINLSFGRYGGPHDGSSVLEKYLDKVVTAREKTRIVLPAGNSRQARCHSVVTKTDLSKHQGEVTLNWRVQPDDKSHSYLQIWLPADGNADPPQLDRVKISVTAPNGDISTELGEVPGQPDLIYQVQGNTVCRVTSSFIEGDTHKTLFTLSMMPTIRDENLDGSAKAKPIAPAGMWKVVISDLNLPLSSEIHAWIERDDTVYSYQVRGRQSYFENMHYQRYSETYVPIEFDPNDESYTKRLGTLNGIATGNETIVVGAMYGKEEDVTEYSSCGPGTVPYGSSTTTRNGPDLLTVSDGSKVHRGIRGAGTRSGSVTYFNGTSVAAPLVAREVADLLAAGGTADRSQLASIVSGQNAAGGTDGKCDGNGQWKLKHPHDSPLRVDAKNIGIS